ncbi:MAG: transposase [Alphaproteobacteria bacterium]|nr:transposase [Alphaproteobacteria bacterium]
MGGQRLQVGRARGPVESARLYFAHLRKGLSQPPLNAEARGREQKASHVRVRIEHVFGHIETSMHGCYIRTIGIARAKAKIGLEVLAYNISRFTFLMRAKGRPVAA